MTQIVDILQGSKPEQEELYANFKPVRYRYVMTYLQEHTDPDTGAVMQPGAVLAILNMTSVTYRNGMYAGTEMAGTVNLPEQTLDEMPHPPVNDFDRWVHPDVTGVPVGSMFECGNRAIYVMRNEEVVWGGILWTRSYSSGTPQLTVTAISFDAYVYYRVLLWSLVWLNPANMYTIWWVVLANVLSDFNVLSIHNVKQNVIDGATLVRAHVPDPEKKKKKNKGSKKPHKKGDSYWVPAEDSEPPVDPDPGNPWPGNPNLYQYFVWTGLSREMSNADPRYYIETWPNNVPRIELPDEDLRLYLNGNEVLTKVSRWRGYDLLNAGSTLEEWADTDTISSSDEGGKTRMEYRVVCWFDSAQQRFRQRYIVGNMSYPAGQDPNEPYPNGIISPLLGKNTRAIAVSPDNQLVFDFPGNIASWSLEESMEEAATRVIVYSSEEAATKHAEYACDKPLLYQPPTWERGGREGWLLYDKAVNYDITTDVPNQLRARAERLLQLFKVPQAAQISDITAGPIPPSQGQRTSIRATTLSITLYSEPSRPLPEFAVGDWATFAIEDPFYGGKMYLVRRIMGYTVTVVPEQESDYSHESIELELTDDTQIDLG